MYKLLALSAVTLSLFSCASRPVSAEHNRTPASEREIDCRAVMCPSFVRPPCKSNEKIELQGDGCCKKPVCVPKKSPDCTRVRCMMKMPKCMRGEKVVDRREPGACCPDYKCENQFDSKCLNAACPAVEPPTCEEGQQLMDLRDKGACCPNWSCEDEGDSNEEL